jgi:uncharacterized protein Yka (UPF0111/DUF47 family)
MWLADMFQKSRGDRFFDILTRHAGLLCEAARALAGYVDSGNPELCAAVLDLEHRGDLELAGLIEAIRDTFVTPLDRQDLYSLGEAVDDMLDYLAGAAAEIKLFGVEGTPAMRGMCGILVDAATSVEAAVRAIASDPKKAHGFARQACKGENRMEELYRSALAELFDGDDVRSMLKLREIYRHLSNSADRADAVGKLVGKIVVKTT